MSEKWGRQTEKQLPEPGNLDEAQRRSLKETILRVTGATGSVGAAAFGAGLYVNEISKGSVDQTADNQGYREIVPGPNEQSLDELVQSVVRAELEQQNSEITDLERSLSNSPGPLRMEVTHPSVSPDSAAVRPEVAEVIPGESESRFEQQQVGLAAFLRLRHDEVLYVDAAGQPVGEPQRFQDYVDEKEGFDGAYKFTPGVTDPTSGLLLDVASREWRDYVQQLLQQQYPDQEIVGSLNVQRIFEGAYYNSDDPQLQELIRTGEIVSRDQLLAYFIHQEVTGFPQYSNRVEYLQGQVQFRSETEVVRVSLDEDVSFVALPDIVQAELRRILPGVIGQESGYQWWLQNARTGATGFGQFMPETWKRYTGTTEVSTDFAEQVAVLGPCISDIYDRVLDEVGDEALTILRDQFETEEDFLLQLVVPLTISGFNAGPDRIALAAKLYALRTQAADMPTGRDLFLAIADFGRHSNEGLLAAFGPEAEAYVPGSEAHARLIENLQQYEQPSWLVAQAN